MFDRVNYKNNARKQLKGKWKTPAIVSAIFFAISVLPNIKAITLRIQNGVYGSYETSTESTIGLIFIAAMGVLWLAWTKIFIKIHNENAAVPFEFFLSELSDIIRGALAILWFFLWTAIWSFFFVIPGIVKALSYSQMFFILAENPDMGVRKAMNISKILTKGYKTDLLVMELSFIPWELLSLATAGLFSIPLTPYKQMAYTNAYYDMKKMAFQDGRLSPSDFN